MSKGLHQWLIFYLLLIILLISSMEVESDHPSNKLITVAHRGASYAAPENTFAAFEKALAMKADYIELDIQRSRDGKLVVIHDLTVDRTTNGTGLVQSFTVDQLKELDAGSWFSSSFRNERIPLLAEILERYRNKPIGFLIELKDPHYYPGVEHEVIKMLNQYNTDNPIIVQSFNPHSIKRFHMACPSIPTGILINNCSHLYDETIMLKLSKFVTYINPHFLCVNAEIISRIHSFGMKTFTWVVNQTEHLQIHKNMGVNGVITDRPDLPGLRSKSFPSQRESRTFSQFDHLNYLIQGFNDAARDINSYIPYIQKAIHILMEE